MLRSNSTAKCVHGFWFYGDSPDFQEPPLDHFTCQYCALHSLCCNYMLIIWLWLCSDLQDEPTACVTHQGNGSLCPASTAPGQTTRNAPATWLLSRESNRKCVQPFGLVSCLLAVRHCLSSIASLLPTELVLPLQGVFKRLHVIYTVGYSISLASLLVAVFILCYYKWVGEAARQHSAARHAGKWLEWQLKKCDILSSPQTPLLHPQLHSRQSVYLLHMSSHQHFCERRSSPQHIQQWSWPRVHRTEAPHGEMLHWHDQFSVMWSTPFQLRTSHYEDWGSVETKTSVRFIRQSMGCSMITRPVTVIRVREVTRTLKRKDSGASGEWNLASVT